MNLPSPDTQEFIDWLRESDPDGLAQFQASADRAEESLEEFLVRALEMFLMAYTAIAGCPCWRCRVAELADTN